MTNLVATLLITLSTNWTHVGEFRDKSVFVGQVATNYGVQIALPDGRKMCISSNVDWSPNLVFKAEKQTNYVITVSTNSTVIPWYGISQTNMFLNGL